MDRQTTRDLVVEQAMRCWQLWTGPDSTPSPAEQRKIMEDVIQDRDFAVGLRGRLDNATWARITTFHEGNKLDFWYGDVLDHAQIETAVRAAYDDLGPNPKGRPAGTWSLARLQLAHGLAFTWWRLTMPVRRGSTTRFAKHLAAASGTS